MANKTSRHAMDQDEMMKPAYVYQVQRVWDFIEETVVEELKEVKCNQKDMVVRIEKIAHSMPGLATKEDLKDLEERMDEKIDAKIETAIGKDRQDLRKQRFGLITAIIVGVIGLISTILGIIL